MKERLLFLFRSFSHLRINEDTSAEFANDDFLTLADVELSLSRNFSVATSTAISFNFNDCESVVCVFADTLESSKETFVDMFLEVS